MLVQKQGVDMSEQQPWDASGTAQDFRFYRDILEHSSRAQSMETEGIFDEAAFALAMADPRTARLTVETDGTPRTVPLLTPLENVGEQWNQGFFSTYAPNKPPTHYSHLPLALRRHPQAYLEALRPGLERVSRTGGVLVMDYTNEEAPTVDVDLGIITRQLPVTFTAVPGPDGNVTPHFHYASPSKLQTKIDPTYKPASLYAAFDSLPTTLKGTGMRVQPTLTPKDTERIWEFYDPVFGRLSAKDPILAGFNHQELTEIAASPEYIKFINREGTDIANVCLLVDVRQCPWMNQKFYQSRYPEQYDQGLVLLSPGVITNPNLGSAAASLRTMGMVGKVIARAGIEPVLTFACDTESNKQVPKLSHHCLNKAGVQVNLLEPVSQQSFRMLQVTA
jgi:hypothetical protein